MTSNVNHINIVVECDDSDKGGDEDVEVSGKEKECIMSESDSSISPSELSLKDDFHDESFQQKNSFDTRLKKIQHKKLQAFMAMDRSESGGFVDRNNKKSINVNLGSYNEASNALALEVIRKIILEQEKKRSTARHRATFYNQYTPFDASLCLTWKDLTYTAKVNAKEKVILHGISGEAAPGEVNSMY